MPIYEYRCPKCGYEGQAIFPAERPRKSIRCQGEGCKGRATRVYSVPAIHYRGQGFYNTDYKRKREHGAKEDKPTPQETKEKADASKPTKPTHDP